MSTLIEAAKAGDTTKVREELQPRWWRKPNPNATDKWGCTALHYAAEIGNKEIVEALLAAGADVNAANRFAHSPLHNAAREGRVEIVQLLLQQGAEICGHEKQDGTPLNWAIREKRAEVVRVLLAAGAATQSVNKDGQSALQVAETYGTLQIVELVRGRLSR